MTQKKIGTATCPRCGKIELHDPDLLKIYMPKGLTLPIMMITCQQCEQPFLAKLSWDSAYKFDMLGCEVIGFSRRTAKQFTRDDINEFMDDFDYNLAIFLDIVESESDVA